MVVAIGDTYVQAARRREAIELMLATQERVRAAPGCVSYVFAELVEEPGRFVVIQEWRDQAALDAHYRSAEFAAYQERLGPLETRPSELRLHHVQDTFRPQDSGPMDPRRAD